MIITCPNCMKQFKIVASQIPSKGRNLQCGSCGHAWFFKIEEESSELLTLNDELSNNKIETNKIKNNIEKTLKYKNLKTNNKTAEKEKEKKSGSKIFANLVVFIISFVALIILIDTLKKPLINIFPGTEIILLNLFETLQDIKLFIIDFFN